MVVNQVKRITKKEFLEFRENYLDLLVNYDIKYIDGKTIQEEQDYLTYFKDAYEFSARYGNNYHAFIDCMRDLDFRSEQGFVLVIYNSKHLLAEKLDERADFIQALEYIAFYHEKECLAVSGGTCAPKSFDVYLIEEILSQEDINGPHKMNTQEMIDELNRIGVPQKDYRINGHLTSDTYFFNQIYHYWEVFYFDEKGNQNDYRQFLKEEEACEYFLSMLRKYAQNETE